MDFAKPEGKLVAQLWLMDGQIGREGHSSTSWSTVPKVLSFSSQLLPLKVPKLFKLFKDVVNFVGPEHVVHFVNDNASNMVVVGRKLEDEFPSIYWSPCTAHCLNLVLSDFAKENLVKTSVAHASSITNISTTIAIHYIY